MGEKIGGCAMGAICIAPPPPLKYNHTQEQSHKHSFTEFLSYYSFPWDAFGTRVCFLSEIIQTRLCTASTMSLRLCDLVVFCYNWLCYKLQLPVYSNVVSLTAKTCPPPDSVAHGHIRSTFPKYDKSIYPEGVVVTFACDARYKLLENTGQRRCQSGSWSGGSLHCGM